MATNYPGANDSFNVPSSPASTPLSSSGTGSRNHWEHHRDLGDAIVALETNVSLINHDHSGTGARPTNKLYQINTHEGPDTDTGVNSIHHTLGTGAFQAAAGNHDHATSVKITTNQSVDGIKTFVKPPVINDLSGMQHTHDGTPGEGGFAYSAMRRDQVAVGQTKGSGTSVNPAIGGFTFNVPAGIYVGGTAVLNFILNDPTQIQEVTLYCSMGTGTGGISIINGFSPVSFRWPGGALGGTGNVAKLQLVAPFTFGPSGSARNSYKMKFAVNIGTGSPTVFVDNIQYSMQLEVLR